MHDEEILLEILKQQYRAERNRGVLQYIHHLSLIGVMAVAAVWLFFKMQGCENIVKIFVGIAIGYTVIDNFIGMLHVFKNFKMLEQIKAKLDADNNN